MVIDEVKAIIAESLNIDVDEIELTHSLRNDFNLDSLDLVELAMTLEDEFGLEVEDEDFEDIDTVESVIDYIESKTS